MVSTVSPQHHRVMTQKTAGPIRRLAEMLTASDPGRLAAFNTEYEALAAEHLSENVVRGIRLAPSSAAVPNGIIGPTVPRPSGRTAHRIIRAVCASEYRM